MRAIIGGAVMKSARQQEYEAEFDLEMRERLPLIRKTLGLSEREAANAAGVTLKTYRKWEETGRVRSADPLRKLCDEFDVSLNWLMMGEEISSPNGTIWMTL